MRLMPGKSLFASGSTFDISPFALNGALRPIFKTDWGALFRGDCISILGKIADQCIDTVFADPPFNIGNRSIN